MSLIQVIPKLPMRNAAKTKEYYCDQLKFDLAGDYGDYLLFKKENLELHFFHYAELNPHSNYGQVYILTENIDQHYQSYIDQKIEIHPNGHLETKPWGQREFSLLDPDNNLLTFGQSV
jgi:catechol 2,3-dioxygenase-like lactoylglutathione lyase family enzyme